MSILYKASLMTKAALALPLFLLAAHAQAVDGGTVNFSGNVTTNTCNISVGGTSLTGSNAASVTLPNVNTTTLASVNAVAGNTPFAIAVSGCSTTATNFTIVFSPDQANVTNDGKLKNTATTGAASGVVLEIINSTTNSILNLFTSSGTPTNTVTAPLLNKGGTQNFQVQYRATAASTAGLVSASLPFTITYQ